MSRATAVAAFALLTACVGCSPRPAIRPGGDFSVRPEKQVFFAISAAQASDEQRVQVLAAYDDSGPRLKELGAEAERAMAKWRELDRRDPAFAEKASALADQYGAITRERMALTAVFEARVAGILDKDQWHAWQNFWTRREAGPGEGEGEREPEGERRGGRHRLTP